MAYARRDPDKAPEDERGRDGGAHGRGPALFQTGGLPLSIFVQRCARACACVMCVRVCVCVCVCVCACVRV